MKTVTICGSMRFEEQMQAIALKLEIDYGFNILQCIYNPEKTDISDIGKQTLANAHLQKIDLSDAIYVVDIDHYIGESVKREIAYVKSKGKEILFHSRFEKAL